RVAAADVDAPIVVADAGEARRCRLDELGIERLVGTRHDRLAVAREDDVGGVANTASVHVVPVRAGAVRATSGLSSRNDVEAERRIDALEDRVHAIEIALRHW